MAHSPPSDTTDPGAANPGLQPASLPRPVDVESGSQSVRLAETAEEIAEAQGLRYRVFYEERRARPTDAMAEAQRDFDDFDTVADHLLVLHRTSPDAPQRVIGTYRLIRRVAAARQGGFYTADEYVIDMLTAHPGEVLELGRSCVDEAFRNRPTMQLLWRGIAQYVVHHKIELMFGCASLPGVNPADMAQQLSYLYHYHLAPAGLCPRALESRYVNMNILPKDAFDAKRAAATLPPLIKGYIRLGGYVGDGAVIDHQFNTTDVCVVVKTDLVTEKYFKHYTRDLDMEV